MGRARTSSSRTSVGFSGTALERSEHDCRGSHARGARFSVEGVRFRLGRWRSRNGMDRAPSRASPSYCRRRTLRRERLRNLLAHPASARSSSAAISPIRSHQMAGCRGRAGCHRQCATRDITTATCRSRSSCSPTRRSADTWSRLQDRWRRRVATWRGVAAPRRVANRRRRSCASGTQLDS